MFCSVHSWQNGTRCGNGVKVLWFHSHFKVREFLSVPSLHVLVLFRKLFVTYSCCFIRNGKREKRWEGRPRGRCMVCKV